MRLAIVVVLAVGAVALIALGAASATHYSPLKGDVPRELIEIEATTCVSQLMPPGTDGMARDFYVHYEITNYSELWVNELTATFANDTIDGRVSHNDIPPGETIDGMVVFPSAIWNPLLISPCYDDYFAELNSVTFDLEHGTQSAHLKIAKLESRIDALEEQLRSLVTESNTGQTGVKGKAFLDANNNGTFDPGEPVLPGRVVITVNTADFTNTNRLTTDANGDYSATLDAGGYLIQLEGGGPNAYAYITIPNDTMVIQNLAN